jgi:hypothetical protein
MMTWFTRITRFGDVHMVYSQENANSCGIACVRMVIFKTNKLKPTLKSTYTESALDKAYGKITHTNYNGSTYSDSMELVKLLNQYTSASWRVDYVGDAGISDVIMGSVKPSALPVTLVGQAASMVCDPVIVLVGWESGARHFVVIDTVHQINGANYASVCDPWDGDVHITKFTPGQPFSYTATQSPFSWSTSKSEHSYKAEPSQGAGNGWIIRKS